MDSEQTADSRFTKVPSVVCKYIYIRFEICSRGGSDNILCSIVKQVALPDYACNKIEYL